MTADIGGFRVGDSVRCERDAPAKGSWHRYAGKIGTVTVLNVEAGEIGVVGIGIGDPSHGRAAWFLPSELVPVTAPQKAASAVTSPLGAPQTPEMGGEQRAGGFRRAGHGFQVSGRMTETCEPCEHAAAHGWWGPKHQGTHCRVCHRSWTGLAEQHCPTCHNHFTSGWAADMHRATGVCVAPAEVLTKDGAPALKPTSTARYYPGVTWTDARKRPAGSAYNPATV